MEGDFVCVRVDTCGVVGACLMEKNQVNHGYGSDDERQQEVECEKAGKCGVIYREATPDSLNECAADIGDGREQVRNDGGASKGHLPSREDVANEGSHHH